MIIRMVKMHFRPEDIGNFQSLFYEVKPFIESFEGCQGVKLLQDQSTPEIFFTLSHWDSEQNLDLYRKSELFAGTWTKTKAMFSAKAHAWSTIEV